MVYACRHEGSDQVTLKESVDSWGNDQVISMVSFCLEDSAQVTSMGSVYLEGSVQVTVIGCASVDTLSHKGSSLDSWHRVTKVERCRHKMEDVFVGRPLVPPWQALGCFLLHHDYTAFCYVS